jgi:hypothetical protein
VGSSISHNPIGLHGLLRGQLYFAFTSLYFIVYHTRTFDKSGPVRRLFNVSGVTLRRCQSLAYTVKGMGKDLEGSASDLTEVLSQHFPWGKEENCKTPSVRIDGVPDEIRTQDVAARLTPLRGAAAMQCSFQKPSALQKL